MEEQRIERYEGPVHDLKKQLAQVTEERDNLKCRDIERSKLARGVFFTQLQDVVRTEQVDFEYGFEKICGRFQKGDEWRKNSFPEYHRIVLEMRSLASRNPDELSEADMSFTSESWVSDSRKQKAGFTKLQQDSPQLVEFVNRQRNNRARFGGVYDEESRDKKNELIDAGTVTNKGHLLAGNSSCGPMAGLFVQAIVGENLEKSLNDLMRDMLDIKDMKKLLRLSNAVLRSLAFHQRDYKGFCHLERNSLYVPKSGHEKFFDQECSWIIVPIMPLEKMIHWTPQQYGGYWVMFVAGTLDRSDPQAYIHFLQASTSTHDDEHVFITGRRERCETSDVHEGIRNLELFVKAFADLATGRSNDGKDQKYTPFDLAEGHKQPHDMKELKVVQKKLSSSRQVTVPKPKNLEDSETCVMKLFIEHNDQKLFPDPMAVAAKGALNWMMQTNEKVIPACRQPIGKTAGHEMAESVAANSSRDDDDDSVDSCSLSYIRCVMKSPLPRWTDIPKSIVAVTPEKQNEECDDSLSHCSFQKSEIQ